MIVLVYSAKEETDQLISTDTMVEGVHFSFHYMKPYDVGYRLMTANLSDIAAMGGTPRQIVLSVAAPDHVDTVILDEIYRGIKDQCMQISTQYTWVEIRYVQKGPWFGL